ncbi:hypothetical protein [Paenibacillus abyssi]|uniref:Uncharacterized protein n=1 Tax=Paenibacillus abyssi TaxID=1340531 RepID=A0A917FKK9_9BACL|nr:hypothetical protein [Paenibacillus abyssi]GGF86853.1 hypothetical protein GCM10010916_00230 [Paenibacillus abyssi]
MSLVDLSGVSGAFFIMAVVFILLVFGLMSLGVVRMFQLRYRAGWLSFAGAIISGVVFGIILDRWYM